MLNPLTMRVIFMTAILSGLLTILGISISAPSADWYLKAVIALTGIVITFVISLFWQYAFNIVPDLAKRQYRLQGWSTVLGGVGLIFSVSTYWNVVTLTSEEISRISGKTIVTLAEEQAAKANRSVNSFLTFVGDIKSFKDDRYALQQDEINGGSSGIAKVGPVSNTFGQVVTTLESIETSITTARGELQSIQARITACLADLSSAMDRGDRRKASNAVSCINQNLSQMAGLDVASSIERNLQSLTFGVVIPSNIKTQAQRDAIALFMEQTQTRANALADKIASREKFALLEPLTLEQPNILKGVLVHWQSLIPSIATALAIDLLPLILLIFTVIRFDDRDAKTKPRNVWTADELVDAIEQMKLLERRMVRIGHEPDLPDYIDIEPKPPATLQDGGDV